MKSSLYSIKNFFEKNLLFSVLLGVTTIHFVLIGWSFVSRTFTRTPPNNKIVVKTIFLEVEKSKVAVTKKTATPPVNPQKKNVQKEQKKETPPIRKESPTTQKKNSLSRELIAELQQVKNNFSRDQKASTLQDLSSIESLKIEGVNSAETDYYEKLGSNLKATLHLPEKGKSEILLKLGRDGKVISVIVVSTTSDLNRHFIEKTLNNRSFPPFKNNFKEKKEYTFPITLVNE